VGSWENCLEQQIVPDVVLSISPLSGGIPPMVPTERSKAIANRVAPIVEHLGYTFHAETRGGSSDGGSASALGFAALDGFGVVGHQGHSPEEFIDLASVPHKTAILPFCPPLRRGNENTVHSPSPNPALEGEGFNLSAITQRPMFMYHSWGSQNKWLRQIAARNYLYLNPQTAAANGVHDEDWIWLASPRGRIRVQAKLHAGTAPGTVWTWNAIGKHKGAWKLSADAPENVDGFLLNDLIDESLPAQSGRMKRANADPVTGQAAWFDLRVRIERDPDAHVPGHRIQLHARDMTQ